MDNLRIDGQRLWDTITQTGRIGGTAKGGVKRLTLTDLDRQVRDWFRAACEAAGATIEIDALGTMYARRPGQRPDLPPIAVGSHLDTQPTGGKFDGILGVLAGLELLRTLQDAAYETRHPIEVINWTNEEGARFQPAMAASGVFSGALTREAAESARDSDGVTFAEALDAIGYRGPAPIGRKLAAFFELHIEQGPILEAEGHTIGVVTGAQGVTWLRLVATGREAHAGTTPMNRRRDALLASSRLIETVDAIARRTEGAVATVGTLRIAEPSINVIPGRVEFTVDLRHPDGPTLDRLEREIDMAAMVIAQSSGVTLEKQPIWRAPPTRFDADCVAAVRRAAEGLGLAHRDIVSGAGHDAVNLARVCPAAMVFVPCADGISHNELESATLDDCAAGAQVLLRAVLETDKRLAG